MPPPSGAGRSHDLRLLAFRSDGHGDHGLHHVPVLRAAVMLKLRNTSRHCRRRPDTYSDPRRLARLKTTSRSPSRLKSPSASARGRTGDLRRSDQRPRPDRITHPLIGPGKHAAAGIIGRGDVGQAVAIEIAHGHPIATAGANGRRVADEAAERTEPREGPGEPVVEPPPAIRSGQPSLFRSSSANL